jgi:uncharacterized protein (DUF697 family)
MFQRVGHWLKSHLTPHLSDEEFRRQRAELLKKTPVPTIWLFGKTGSGKSSVIRYLTGVEAIRIGSGFKPETRHSHRYDFPTADQPVLQFLDTRGLGETDYDPTEDINQFEDDANLVLVTVRVLDGALDGILKPLRAIRKAKRSRPVLLMLTCLHDAYPQQQHPQPDPFADLVEKRGQDSFRPEAAAQTGDSIAEKSPDPFSPLPDALKTAIRNQQQRFEGLVDRIVPVDFTQPEDGFEEQNFGGERLKQAIIDLLPDVYRQAFLRLEDEMDSLQDLHERRAMPYILGAASMSASAAAFPVPWIDLPVVAAIQSDMIRRISRVYNQPMDVQQFLKMAGAVGGPLFLRHMVRESLKAIPVVGSAANAALAFATTYALGKACCWYFGEILSGHVPSSKELKEQMAKQMDVARGVWQRGGK